MKQQLDNYFEQNILKNNNQELEKEIVKQQ